MMSAEAEPKEESSSSSSSSSGKTNNNNNMNKMIELISSDGEKFEVKRSVMVMESATINHELMIKKDQKNVVIPVDVTGKNLAKVIEFCNRHADAVTKGHMTVEEIKLSDTQFLNSLDDHTFYDLILAADCLKIKSLLDVACRMVAAKITPEEYRKMFLRQMEEDARMKKA